MDIFNTVIGVLFCSVECAFEREPSTDIKQLIKVPSEKFDRPLYGCYCPTCLTPYEGFSLNPDGGVSDGLTEGIDL